MMKLKLQYFGTSCEELTHWKRPWCWERLGAGGEGDRGWDGWMASPTQWTWVWVNSGSWWWTGRPGVLQFMGSQRVGHNWATELNWTVVIRVLTTEICTTVYITYSLKIRRLEFLWGPVVRTSFFHCQGNSTAKKKPQNKNQNKKNPKTCTEIDTEFSYEMADFFKKSYNILSWYFWSNNFL